MKNSTESVLWSSTDSTNTAVSRDTIHYSHSSGLEEKPNSENEVEADCSSSCHWLYHLRENLVDHTDFESLLEP